MTNVMVLGASGMLGNAVVRVFDENGRFNVTGVARSPHASSLFPQEVRRCIKLGPDLENTDAVLRLFDQVAPSIVVNCVGLVKQLADSEEPISAIPINALLPHRLARICALSGARLIHMSTDCVFSGARGNYSETDFPDASDLYGRSKYLGEVDYPNAVTLRTSIIGHELNGARSLVGWFLAQEGSVRGFTRAFFSGLPTVEVARIIRDVVVPAPSLRGTYHVSAASISKFDLLRLVAEVYGKTIEIIPDESLAIDRSLDSTRFKLATGYAPPSWPDLISAMYKFR